MKTCYSVLGPPPGCGHTPTVEQPICETCTNAHDRFRKEFDAKEIEKAKRVLQSHGYMVIAEGQQAAQGKLP